MSMTATCTIGFPRIGPKREMKKALEKYWSKKCDQDELLATHREVTQNALEMQRAAGIQAIGLDGTLFDQVLDAVELFGLAPERFDGLDGLDKYFAMARGAEGIAALDMQKLYNTNYHYMVPEISAHVRPTLHSGRFIEHVQLGQAALGTTAAVPMLIGPVTLAALSRVSGTTAEAVTRKLVPLYRQLLQQLAQVKVGEVQLLEPALVMPEAAGLRGLYEESYEALAGVLPINLVTFFDDLGECYPWAVQLPVQAVSIDFIGSGMEGPDVAHDSLAQLKKYGFPAEKRLGAGIIDGRNVWADTGRAAELLAEIKAAGVSNVCVQSSCSLQFVPIDLDLEPSLPNDVRRRLAFAKQKLGEIVAVASGKPASSSKVPGAAASELDIPDGMFSRAMGYQERRKVQAELHAELPPFPTTTIGSFPQTPAIRAARAAFKAGRIDDEEYRRRIDAYIAHAIGVQEGVGLDVLVHGEPERSDMVEFFGQQLNGMLFTQHGWVQSYGSRCVRPPIIYGDVARPHAMTLREFAVAQGLSKKPVKGMLTGPVTILKWSFPRADVPHRVSAMQLALAIRKEVADLQDAGCSIIQVDEPALREGLPLKRAQWDAYLQWAVDSFRLACSAAAPATQIVTHLCYSEFQDILPAIDRMDADVLTIENSRSGDSMVRAMAASEYSRDIGPGVYDIHSPVVPAVDFMVSKIATFRESGILGGDAGRIWVNPDCGLKTRRWEEVVPSLRHMVEAAKIMRKRVGHVAPAAEPASCTHTARCC